MACFRDLQIRFEPHKLSWNIVSKQLARPYIEGGCADIPPEYPDPSAAN